MRRLSRSRVRGTAVAIFALAALLLPPVARASDFEQIFTDQFDKKSVWQWLLGEKSYATIDYGYWYAWWIPQSLGQDQRSFTVTMDAALLKETSFRISARGRTNFLVKYVTDEFFKQFESEADLRYTNEQKTRAKEIFAALRHQLIPEWPIYLQGRATVGEFRGYALGPQSGGFYATNAPVTNTANGQGRAWSTQYREYELDALLAFFAVGVRFIDYDRPFNVFFTPTDTSAAGTERSGTYLSSYTATYLNLGFIVNVYAKDFYAEVHSLYGFGGGSVKNPYMSDIKAKGFYFDNVVKMGFNLVSLGSWVDVRLYLGYRLMGMSTSVGEITGYSDNPVATLTQNSVYNAGRQGNVYAAEWDYFHGPVFGASLRF